MKRRSKKKKELASASPFPSDFSTLLQSDSLLLPTNLAICDEYQPERPNCPPSKKMRKKLNIHSNATIHQIADK